MRDASTSPSIVWVAVAAAAGVAALAPAAAVATEYLTAAQAQALMFPKAATFKPMPVALGAAQKQALEDRLGGHPTTGFMHVSEALDAGGKRLGFVVTDSVVGKFELIDYAVALQPDGTIADVEVLAYRESHGGEVRTEAWRRQFVGKTAAAPLTVGNDIANISGATMSVTHLTDGVRRVAAFAQVALVGKS